MDFLRARLGKHLKDVLTSSLFVKGSTANHQGIDCLVKRAFDNQWKDEILQIQRVKLPAPHRTIEPHVLECSQQADVTRIECADILPASVFLKNPAWVTSITSTVVGRSSVIPISAEHIQETDALMSIIFARLQTHILFKVPAGRRRHWCLDWVKTNIGVMCVLGML